MIRKKIVVYRGGSGKYLRKVCRKFVPAVIWYPPTNFFHKLRFFSSSFSGPTNFFPKIQIFSSEIWRPTHISTENSHLPNFWPFDFKTMEKICRSAFLVPTKSAYFPQIFACPLALPRKIARRDKFHRVISQQSLGVEKKWAQFRD